jgi:hypothetical protein
MASSKGWPYTISMNKSKKLRPGEKVFSVILIIFSAILFFESFKISGFSGLTTSGAMPMFASTLMFIASIFIFLETLKKDPKNKFNLLKVTQYLLPKQLIFFVSLVLIYVLAIPYFGFTLSSGTFLIISILNLWNKGILWSLGVSVFSIAVIYFLFRIVFQVILPLGSYWL